MIDKENFYKTLKIGDKEKLYYTGSYEVPLYMAGDTVTIVGFTKKKVKVDNGREVFSVQYEQISRIYRELNKAQKEEYDKRVEEYTKLKKEELNSIDNDEIRGKCFINEEGDEWTPYSPAGTGQYLWWCRNIDTHEKKEFATETVLNKIKTYNIDIENFKIKENLENSMEDIIKKISDKIIRQEILKEEEWSDKEIDILHLLRNGQFSIKADKN